MESNRPQDGQAYARSMKTCDEPASRIAENARAIEGAKDYAEWALGWVSDCGPPTVNNRWYCRG